MRLRLFVIFLPVLFCPFFSRSQWSADDSLIYRAAIANTEQVYFDRIGDQSPLYNGRLYYGYPFTFTAGIPFFLSREFRKSSLNYEGLLLENVPLLYDDLSEAVITLNRGFWIQLINERLSWFTIDGHQFIRIVVNKSNQDLYGTGFYEVLYEGHTVLLKKMVKKIREELTTSEGILRYIDEYPHYYVKMGNAYFPVNRKKEMLTVFSDHKKELSQFMRKNKLKFRKDPQGVLTKVTAYYDQIRK